MNDVRSAGGRCHIVPGDPNDYATWLGGAIDLDITRMKSAYELAMERLQKGAPSVSLTEDQKKQLAEIDSTFRAKIAEREVFLKGEIAKLQAAGGFEEVEALQKQLASEVRRLHDDWDSKKEKLRSSFGN